MSFRFCGKEISQTPDCSIALSCKDATETIGPARYEKHRRLTDDCNEAEIAQMRSVIGSLGWIARQHRPDLSYHVSRLQGTVSGAKVRDLKNKSGFVASFGTQH